MDADNDESGLFAIDITPDVSEAEDESPKVPRDFQSREDFEAQRKAWRPKCEVGNLYKTLSLPIHRPSKQESQIILHSIEELYFLRRYDEALSLASKAMEGELAGEFRAVVAGYRDRCEGKLKTAGPRRG